MKEGSRGPRREALLECQHRPYFDPPYPVPNDTVYCRWCRDYRRVLSLFEQYSVRCLNHCRLHRGYGMDLGHAERVAHSHVTRYPQAHVTISQGSTLIVDLRSQQESFLPEYQAAKERERNLTKEHQTSLRRFIESLPAVEIK